MELALACSSLRTGGGLERDCLDIAQGLGALGHRVTLLSTSFPEPSPTNLSQPIALELLPRSGLSNHARVCNFSRSVQAWRRVHAPDAVIGFQKMPGIDYYYAAAEPWPRHGWPKSWLPRHRAYTALERSVFADPSRTFVFFLAEGQARHYRRFYRLADDRFSVLPLTLRSDRRPPETFYASRARIRQELGIPDDHTVLVNVALYGRQKGTDRAIDALASLPNTTLLSVGLKNADEMVALASRAGVSDRVRFVGYATNIDELIGASDLMVHPAREEATGTVIIESLLYGVPVVCSNVCGFAHHVEESEAGRVLAEPFGENELVRTLRDCLAADVLEALRDRARAYSPALAATAGGGDAVRHISETIEARLRQSWQPT